jgi:hypothetical protein
MGFDRKYGKVTTEHGEIPDDEPVIVFRARDKLVPAMLTTYIQLCEQAGSPARHIDLVEGSKRQIVEWQRDNKDQVRKPDSERSRAWMKE